MNKTQSIRELAYKYIDRIRETSISLKTLLKDEEVELREQIIQFIHEEAKKELLPQLVEFSNAIFLAMQKSNNFGVWGRQRLALSHYRNILHIPCDRQVNCFDQIRVEKIIDTLDENLGRKSGEELIQYCKQKSIILFMKSYSNSDLDELRDFVALLDAPYYFYKSDGIFCKEFIYGEVQWASYDEINIYTFSIEWARSPSHNLYIAARAPNEKNKFQMQIREEALQVAFFNKWVGFSFQSIFDLEHPYDVLCEGFKKNSLKFAGIKTKNDIKKIGTDTLFELTQIWPAVIYHELGHYISTKYSMSMDDQVISDTFRKNDNVIGALGEILADWAPQYGKKKGTVQYLAEIGLNNPASAAIIGWSYCSDNWHPDKKEPDFLFLRSITMVALMLSFVNDDSTFDSAAIISELPMVYKTVVKLHEVTINGLRDIIFSYQYENNKNYSDIEKILNEKLITVKDDEIIRKYKYWDDMLNNYVKNDSVLEKTIEDYLITQGKDHEYEVLAIVRNILNRRSIMSKYESLWEFIYERCKEIGIFEMLQSEIDDDYDSFEDDDYDDDYKFGFRIPKKTIRKSYKK